jgi:Phage portal protein
MARSTEARTEARIRQQLAEFRQAQAIAAAGGVVPFPSPSYAVRGALGRVGRAVRNIASEFGFATRSRDTVPSYGVGPYAKYRTQLALQGFDPRRGAQMLRNYSRNNEWVRLAIDYRREQVRMASWKIIRTDDPKKPPDPSVVKAVRKLFKMVNPMRTSFESLLDMVIDDLLVLDAGCIEKEHTYGGAIANLWEVDGATIVPDPTWNGSNINLPRYYQIINGREEAKLRNDQLIYMMRTQTTYSAIGWSPVETLMRVIEADLYGEQYDFSMLKQAAPAGILFLGAGVDPTQTEAFKEYYEEEVAGSQNVAIFGGGEPGEKGPTFTPFQRSNKDNERAAYRDFCIKMIAAIFRVDKGIFNITESVNRATSKTQQTRTDEGLKGLANVIQTYITREIVWEFDEDHGFAFDDLNDRDEAQQAEIDTAYVNAGIWLRNEVRATQGRDPLPFDDDVSDIPATGMLAPEPLAGAADPDPDEEPDDGPPEPPDDDEPPKPGGKAARSATRTGPFVVGAAARMRRKRLAYLVVSTK